MVAPAEILVKSSSENVLELVLSGQWNLGQNLPSTDEVLHRLESSAVKQIIFDSQDIAGWDSGLLTFVKRLRTAGRRKDNSTRYQRPAAGSPTAPGSCRSSSREKGCPQR